MKISRGHSYYALFILTLAYSLNYLDRTLLSILIEPIKNEFEVSDTLMGFLGLSFAAFYATLALPLASYADRSVRRNILAWAAGIWSIMTVLCGYAGNYMQLLLIRIGVAVGEAGGVPPSQSMVADYFPAKNRASAMAIFSSGNFIGTLLAMVLGSWLAQTYGWRHAFIVIGAPGVLLALIIRFTVKEPERGAFDEAKTSDEKPAGFTDFLENVRKLSALRWSILGMATAGMAGYGIGFWAIPFLMRVHELTLMQSGIMIGMLGVITGLIGSLFGGWLTDRLCRKDQKWLLLIPAISLIISLPMMILFIMWPEQQTFTLAGSAVPVAILWYCMAGFFGSWWAAPTYVVVQALVPPQQRTLACAALLFVINLIGFGIGPLLVGFFSDLLEPGYGDHSVRYALLIMMATYVVGFICYFMASHSYSSQRYEERLKTQSEIQTEP